MPSLLLRRDDADAAEINKGTTYIVLGIVFGALAIVCLLITVYLLARLRRADKKLDRELANAPVPYNDDFAPQFKEKHSLSMDYSNDYNYEYARAHAVAPSLPADIIHVGPMPPSPAPMRPVRRPSSLFDRKRASNTPKPPTPHLPDYYNVPPVPRPVPSPGAAQESFERSPPQPAGLTPMPPPRSPPVMRIVAPNSPQRVPVPMMPTPPQPVARPDTLVLPTRPESFTSEYSEYSVQPRDRDQLQTAVSEAPTIRPGFGRSPSLLRKVLHERVGGAAAPAVPSIPEEHRPMVTLSLASVLMPYELESATPGPTPVDVPPPSAATAVAYHNAAAIRRSPEPDMEAEHDPHSAARLTLLQAPPTKPLQPRRISPPPPMPPPQRPLPSPRRPSPPPLTIVIANPNTAGITPGAPPVGGLPAPPVPVRSPLRESGPKRKPAPLTLAPPNANDDVDLRQTVTPALLAAFASKLRPETRDFAAEPVVVPDREDDFRITMRPTHRR